MHHLVKIFFWTCTHCGEASEAILSELLKSCFRSDTQTELGNNTAGLFAVSKAKDPGFGVGLVGIDQSIYFLFDSVTLQSCGCILSIVRFAVAPSPKPSRPPTRCGSREGHAQKVVQYCTATVLYCTIRGHGIVYCTSVAG